MIHGFSHVGISVTNLDKSIQFYRNCLHMDVVVNVNEFEGDLYESILGLPGGGSQVALLKRGTLQLELFQFHYPAPQARDSRYPVSDHEISHFCIEVSNVEAEYDRLKEMGDVFHCPPLDFFGEAKATTIASAHMLSWLHIASAMGRGEL